METLFAVLLVPLLLSVGETKAQKCCVADQFQTRFAFSFVSTSFDSYPSLGRQRIVGSAAFDFANRRYTWNDTTYIDSQTGIETIEERMIFLFNKNTEYWIVEETCFVSSIFMREPPQCIPDNFQYVGSFFAGDDSILLDGWNITYYEGGKLYSIFELATTYEKCIPVLFSYFKVYTKGEQDSNGLDGAFSNYEEGVDPSTFDIPKICHNATVKVCENAIFNHEELALLTWSALLSFSITANAGLTYKAAEHNVMGSKPFGIWQRLVNRMMFE